MGAPPGRRPLDRVATGGGTRDRGGGRLRRALACAPAERSAGATSTHSVDLYDWQPRFPVCIVFGNEVDGVAPEISRLVDVHVRIPMLGVKQSLNVAVAGGVVLYELLRKYRGLYGLSGGPPDT